MADDQKPKTMDINDLVRELSKSSTSPVTPPAPQALRTPFPTPKPPMPSSAGGSAPVIPTPPKPLEIPRPQFNAPISPPSQSKPVAPPTSTASTPPSGVKEYQSSIRTMNEDISKLKQGQKPMGVDVPRKVEQVAPVVPPPMPPKPPMPSPQFKVPSVNLGGAQKTGPLPTPPPSAPIKPKVESKPQIYIPKEGQKGGNRNLLFMGIGAVAIVAGFSYWFFVLRSPAPEVVIESPTPTATPIQDLNTIFSSTTEIEPLTQINGGEFRKDSQIFKTTGLKPKLLEVIEGVGGIYPSDLLSVLRNDGAVFWYGQKELFDSKGQLKVGVLPERILTIISEITDTTATSGILSFWESSMSEDLKLLISTDKSPGYKGPEVKEFLDNNYRGVAIRYKNIPYADKSIDYAIVLASNGKNYFVITSSREAMYATIDKLKGF